MIVVLGELGGEDEYSLCAAMADGRITKPVVAWVSGTCAPLFGGEVQFGHAGARSGGGDRESAAAKNKALREAGATVPTSFEGLEAAIKGVWDAGVAAGTIRPCPPARPARPLPTDLAPALKAGLVRVPTNVVCTISDDRGEEPSYAGVSMSSLLNSGAGVADVVSLLWFKRSLPAYATRFIELCIILCADHGPCVSGAHVAIVTARAGKDLVSCLAAGLLTVGPRFGGAIDDAARRFGAALAAGQSPVEYVESMKAAGARVPGIGHRIKSKDNRDARVALLQVRRTGGRGWAGAFPIFFFRAASIHPSTHPSIPPHPTPGVRQGTLPVHAPPGLRGSGGGVHADQGAQPGAERGRLHRRGLARLAGGLRRVHPGRGV